MHSFQEMQLLYASMHPGFYASKQDKTVYKKNELKNLIYIQDNKPCNEQTIKGLFRSIVEPILEDNAEALVLLRLEEKSLNDFNNILKRLEYSPSKVYDFSDNPLCEKFENVLKEKLWDKTEFIYVLAERFGAVLIFDYEESEIKGFAQIYTLYNSKNLSEAFNIINSNSVIDLSGYYEKFRPDRRDNNLLNISIRKIIESLNETNQEILISQMEKETTQDDTDAAAKLEFLLTKSGYIAHEMRNLLSICSLYSNIIDKQSEKIETEDEETKKSILNAKECIKKTLKMAGNLLLDFKSLKGSDLKECDLKNSIEMALELAKIYAHGKDINFECVIPETTNILADEDKLLAVLINIIKNAVESIEDKGEIIIKPEIKDENVNIIISNNGKPIDKKIQEKICEEGFTTKKTGTGLGLAICKETLKEQFGELKLKKSDEVSTDFEITVLRSEE